MISSAHFVSRMRNKNMPLDSRATTHRLVLLFPIFFLVIHLQIPHGHRGRVADPSAAGEHRVASPLPHVAQRRGGLRGYGHRAEVGQREADQDEATPIHEARTSRRRLHLVFFPSRMEWRSSPRAGRSERMKWLRDRARSCRRILPLL